MELLTPPERLPDRHGDAKKLQPGPLAAEISYFAPAAAFFAFYLLLAYLVDHIDIHAAFIAASAVRPFLLSAASPASPSPRSSSPCRWPHPLE
ncbi:MAG: hypothetical protein IAF94_11565 [Pirellulaceae bacterium]|nr:hypothetical protein [Pirellulaceae bacterium]